MKWEFFLILILTVDDFESMFDSWIKLINQRVVVPMMICLYVILDLVHQSSLKILAETNVIQIFVANATNFILFKLSRLKI